MTAKDFAIGVLSITAVILFVGLVLINGGSPHAAYAYGQNGSGGDYLVTTCQVDDTTELLFILNAAVDRMNVYGFNVTTGRIELLRPPLLVAPQGPPGPVPRR